MERKTDGAAEAVDEMKEQEAQGAKDGVEAAGVAAPPSGKKRFWKDWTTAQRAGAAVGCCAVVAAIVAGGVAASQPQEAPADECDGQQAEGESESAQE